MRAPWRAAVVVAALVAAATVIATEPAHAAVGCTFYLAPDGDDGAAGTAAAPWATLERARDHLRTTGLTADMHADIGICLRGGRYPRTSTFQLTEADSGSHGFRVSYQAYPGETPIIDGGRAVQGWSAVSGQPYYAADVPPAAGYADYFRQLYVGGRRAQLAMGTAITGTAFYDDPATVNPPANPARPSRSYDGIVFPSASLKAYTNVTDIRLLHIAIGFKIDYFPVTGITTTGDGTRVQLAQPHFQARLNRDAGDSLNYNQGFYVLNALQELDSPGEWYLDRSTHRIYYYPLPGETAAGIDTYVPVVETLVDVAGAGTGNKATGIGFSGLTFEHGNWFTPRDRFIGGTQAEAMYADDPFTDPNYDGYGGEVPGSIRISNATDITFTGNTVRMMGNGGLQLSTGAQQVTVTGNLFHNLTAAGVIAGRWMDVHVSSAARTRDILIDDNVVTDTGDDFFAATGISLMNTYGVTVRHNLVYDTAYMGFHQRKAEESSLVDDIGATTVEANQVYNATAKVSWGVGDSGAIYSFGAWPGSVVQDNWVHHRSSTLNYYSDNQSSGTRWDRNVSQGGLFHWPPRNRQPTTVYAGHNYTDTDETNPAFGYGGVIFDQDGPPTVVTDGNWPAEARQIMAGAGLTADHAALRWKVPGNLADGSTLSPNRSTWDTGLSKLWDGTTVTGEASAPANEAWVQFDLPADYQAFTFTVQQDACCTWMITQWKVQRWSALQNAWVDIMPYQSISTTAPVSYTPPSTLATTNLRLYVRNTNSGGLVGIQEFSATGTFKAALTG